MKIALVTDAWTPQVNGVVRTLQTIQAELEHMGHEVKVISPDLYGSIPCPTYPEIRLALVRSGVVTVEKLKEIRPYVIVGAFVLGAIFTPPDVVSQFMLAIPLWLLYES